MLPGVDFIVVAAAAATVVFTFVVGIGDAVVVPVSPLQRFFVHAQTPAPTSLSQLFSSALWPHPLFVPKVP